MNAILPAIKCMVQNFTIYYGSRYVTKFNKTKTCQHQQLFLTVNKFSQHQQQKITNFNGSKHSNINIASTV